jgi:hypothetical protein
MFGNTRKNCSQCGASIVWFKPEEMDAELKTLAKQASKFMGEPVASVWRCTVPACAEVGFFGGIHAG